MTAFALIHSPLVGPSTWQIIAQQLEGLGHRAIVPNLSDSPAVDMPFWQQHAESAVQAINSSDLTEACILVGHSGAGPLLPAIGSRLRLPPLTYIFVDAGLPCDQASRLDLMRAESPEWANEFEQYLVAGGTFPSWSEAELRPVIPAKHLRQRMVQEIRPRGLAFFTETITVPDDWSATRCGYIQFTETYAAPAHQAREAGWPFIRFDAAHFHMLVDAPAVTTALVQIANS